MTKSDHQKNLSEFSNALKLVTGCSDQEVDDFLGNLLGKKSSQINNSSFPDETS